MRLPTRCAVAAALLVCLGAAPVPTDPAVTYDDALARSVGADERGMRTYVLVILKTGPNKIPAGPERDEMFRGHFANMKRLSDAGKLVQAGPLDGVDGWRGLYVFAVAGLEEARALVATDPVVMKGEMVPELHTYYGSAALMMIPGLHAKVSKTPS